MKELSNYAMKSRFIICGICSLFIMLGCDDNLPNEIALTGDGKLKRILMFTSVEDEEPINIVEEYEYDSLDRISRVLTPLYDDGEIVGTSSYSLFEYNADGQLIKKSHYNANLYAPTGFLNLRNYKYTYGSNGKVEREFIEYPQAGSSEYFLHFYDGGHRLVRKEKYDINSELEIYILNEYDNGGKLVKESTYGKDNQEFSYTLHFYTNGLNTLSKVYRAKDMFLMREIYRTYDDNNNLIVLESNEIAPFSSMSSYVLKYEYY